MRMLGREATRRRRRENRGRKRREEGWKNNVMREESN